jgi:serine/threonine-protein kinase
VHRDVKAENILVEAGSGKAMVTDFGIARLAEAAPLTATGTVLGTVHYMSPEQVAGDAVDARSDIYSLGFVAFFALSGRFPFESNTASAVLVAHVTKLAPPLRSVAPNIPPPLANIIDRCLSKDPIGRLQSCAEFIHELERIEPMLPEDPEPLPQLPDALSSDEARDVWKRAAELQDMTGQLPPVRPPDRLMRRTPLATSGFRLDQIRAAAHEAGIGEQYVDRALMERGVIPAPASEAVVVREGVLPRRNPLLGGRSSIAYEAVVPGEMPERDFDVLIDLIRRTLNDAGNVSQVGRSLTWLSADKQRRVQATVLVRDGRTTIHVSERLRDLIGGLYGGIIGGGGGASLGPILGFGLDALNQPVLIIPMVAAAVGTAFGIARTIFSRIFRSRSEVLHSLTERMAQEARDSIARRGIAPGARPERRMLR